MCPNIDRLEFIVLRLFTQTYNCFQSLLRLQISIDNGLPQCPNRLLTCSGTCWILLLPHTILTPKIKQKNRAEDCKHEFQIEELSLD